MKIEKQPVIKCNNCGKTHTIDMDMECVSQNNRQMGTEYEYESVFNDGCPKCGNSLYVKLSVWEYPVGSYNTHELEVENAKVIEEPEFSFISR